MKKRISLSTLLLLILFSLFVVSSAGFSQPPPPAKTELLQQDAEGDVEVTWNSRTGTPSFIRGRITQTALQLQQPTAPEEVAFAFAERYATLFGIRAAKEDLKVVRSYSDTIGMHHVILQQTYMGVEVYNARLQVHLSSDDHAVVAVSSSVVPYLELASVEPKVSADHARTAVKRALPNGTVVGTPLLAIYAGDIPDTQPRLAWFIEMRDDTVPVRNVYVVNATDESIVTVLDRLHTDKNRKTYDAEHRTSLPGTLKRAEGDGPTGDADIDNAHDFAGATYDYYWSTHNRDSYDDQGAELISTANYGQNYKNAFWNGQQMVYGDDFPVNDVVAHELTHAVTEHTANLEYRWQSGALNESFSDVFGAMVDREDWLMGEDLPSSALGGRDAIRDLSDPPRFGQPDHTDDWVRTCSDNEGVHTNSGITNKAYYFIATDIGKDKAERIFYRSLSVYLGPYSSLEDARAAALQSASDLYGDGSEAYTGVEAGFDAVGLDGEWNPPENDCVCAATTALDGEESQLSALQVAATLYGVRDQLLSQTVVGQHYRTLYEENTGRISYLLLLNGSLRSEGSALLYAFTPGLDQLVHGNGGAATVTPDMVTDVQTFLEQLAEADRVHGGKELAGTIEREMARIEWDRLAGMTFAEAWYYLNSHIATTHSTYLPVVAN